jgi:ferredoxin
MEDAEIGKIMIDDEKCTHCGKCLNYCPIGIPIDKTSTIEDCLKCLYCYMVCPEQAISLEGNLGFLEPYFVRTKKLWQAF